MIFRNFFQSYACRCTLGLLSKLAKMGIVVVSYI